MATEYPVHVIDDDEAVRRSLAFLLENAGLKVSIYESARQFLEILPVEGGCVVTDIRMPEISGMDLLRRLSAAGGRFHVIVITGHGEVPLAVEAMRLGAVDFIEKPFDGEVLLASIRAACGRQDDAARGAAELEEILQHLRTLSVRETQVMDGLVAGQPNKVIAGNLGISPRTVEVYRANVMAKMHASNLPSLVKMAVRARDAQS